MVHICDPPENWRQIHHSDKIDMNKIFKGNFIDTHRFGDVQSIWIIRIRTCICGTHTSDQDSDREQKIIQLEHASSFPTICLEFDLNFFLLRLFFCWCAKIIYRWNEKFNVLVISICLGTKMLPYMNIHRPFFPPPKQKSRYGRFIRFLPFAKVCVANNFWWS